MTSTEARQPNPANWRVRFFIFTAALAAGSAFAQSSYAQSVQLSMPKAPQTGMLYHEASDPFQVCNDLGFINGAVINSVVALDPQWNNLQNTVLFGTSGQQSTQSGYGIWKISCYIGNSSAQNPGQNNPSATTLTRITSINGAYDANHSASMYVRPGDVITLSADLLNAFNYQPTYAPVENFQWAASDRTSDACDASSAENCLAFSNFQVNDYGVAFYVPYSMAKEIVITVRDRSNPSRADSITLVNSNYNDGYIPPSVVVSDPNDYPYDRLDPDYALAGHGRWVTVGGHRYFVPYSYNQDADSDWTPYRNGYWTTSANGSMIWVSYDPWGWMTDHYGYWRFHATYGWIWGAFQGNDFRYHDHCVSFFDYDGYVGWYPYYSGYSSGYSAGYDDGFRDGYWAGYNAAQGYGQPAYGYSPGYTIVTYNNFTNVNIVNVYTHVRVNNTYNSTVINVVNGSVRGGRFGNGINSNVRPQLGNIPTGRVVVGRAGIQHVTPVHAVPNQYRQVSSNTRIHQPAAIGSVVDVRGNGQGRVVAPTTNGRGVVTAPVGRAATGTGRVALPPQTSRPAQANPENPGSSRMGSGSVAQPGQPTSRPTLPAPTQRPSQPSRPSQPTQPSQPSRPTQPSQPTQRPSQPTQPSQPSQPSRPSQPTQPSQPSRPTQPSQPSQPTQRPSQPTQPSQPSQPSRPSQPTQPSQPSRPSQPTQPSQPSRPSQPSQPAQRPSQPSQPSQPSRPSQPSQPSRPSAPAPQPSRPSAPSQPSRPSTPAPSRPSSPAPSAPSRSAPSTSPSRPSSPAPSAPSRPAPSAPRGRG